MDSISIQECIMTDEMRSWTEADEVAATVPAAWFKNMVWRKDAVICAKFFCTCGAGQQEIDNLADALERRREVMRGEHDEESGPGR